MLPRLTGQCAERLRGAFDRARYDTTGVQALLGDEAYDALSRGEPVPARRASAAGGELGVLVRLFLLGAAEPESAVKAAFSPLDPAAAVACGVLHADHTDTGCLRAAVAIRPYGDWWVVADLEPSWLPGPPEPEHVLGVGPASSSLARATIRRPVRTLLDLGTGCGVQALLAAQHAERITATDVSPRALALAEATFALNDLNVELIAGPWFEPVAGRRFDQVVSNPPFVVGPGHIEHVYRDSGLAGDTGSALLTRALPDHLTEGGTAQILASWVHPRAGNWADRVTSWLPTSGIDAWVVQRDVADPALYVGTWLADSGLDPRSPQGRATAETWLDWFADHEIDGVGFGFIVVRRSGAQAGTVVCEDLREPMAALSGAEAANWLDRVEWLRSQDDPALLRTRFALGPDVVLDRTDTPGAHGWRPGPRILRRRTGPAWRHETDEQGAALLAGCTGALELGELIGLLASAHDTPADPLVAAVLRVIRELVQHGLLLPTELAS